MFLLSKAINKQKFSKIYREIPEKLSFEENTYTTVQQSYGLRNIIIAIIIASHMAVSILLCSMSVLIAGNHISHMHDVTTFLKCYMCTCI